MATDLDDAGVIRISDERVTVLQPAGEGDTAYRIVDVRLTAPLPDDLAGAGDLDRAVVVFVAERGNGSATTNAGSSRCPASVND